ncbi:MAG: hypothetical protein NTZ12_11255 [Candidatus Aminicenantes bacterium]|nr:hypothetical protein [Candidatus Aminicenantes bacterium]
MKKIKFTFLTLAVFGIAALTFAATTEKSSAQAQTISQKELVQRFGFIDENGDGINDLARDADNDGIPNCMDPDWTRPEDSTGYKNKYGYKHHTANAQNNGGENNFNYSYNYLWSNNWGGCNDTGVCDNTGPHGSQGHKRNSGNRH